MANKVTLESLVNSTKASASENATPNAAPAANFKTAKVVSTSELGKSLAAKHPEAQERKNIVPEDAPLVKDAFDSMNRRLEESRKFIEEEYIPKIEENAREMQLERELGEEYSEDEETTAAPEMVEEYFEEFDNNTNESVSNYDDEEVDLPVEEPKHVTTPVEHKPVKQVREETADDKVTLDDLMAELNIDDDGDNEEAIEEDREQTRERFKESLRDIKITKNPINLGEYTIRKEPISAAAVLRDLNASKVTKKCDWPLYFTGRNMRFEETNGPELDSLKKTINNSNNINGVIASLKFIYNHVVDANKKPFEAWCKSIRTEDIESLYFGIYRATYGDANIVPRYDEYRKKGCKKTSLIDTPISTMVKYKNDDVKNKFDNLFRMDTTDGDRKVRSNLMAISDDLAISYSNPTLYSTFIQYSTLKPEIVEKYSDHLNTMAYIDKFYRIDPATKQLSAIDIKEFPNNINKTILNKLKVYIDLLKTLTIDQYNAMLGKLDNLMESDDIKYVYPKTMCPECGNIMPEQEISSMLQMLFTRAQLVQVKNL